jgi:hypothetical protein
MVDAPLPSKRKARSTEEANVMNKVSLLAGVAIGAVLTAGIAQLQAQAPAPANTTRPAVFYITEQTYIDQAKYENEFAPKVLKTIKDHGGRFIVRNDQVTGICGRRAQAHRDHRMGIARRCEEVASE